MGRQKLLLPLGDKPVVRYIAETILTMANPLIVVVGSNGDEVRAALKGLDGLIVVENQRWQDGMVSSAQVGIEALVKNCSGVAAFFLHQADKPFVPASVFATLTRHFTMSNRTGKTKNPTTPPGAAASNETVSGADTATGAVDSAEPCALVASHCGESGHPVLFPVRYIPDLLSLPAGERLKPVLDRLGSLQIECGTEAVLEDIDTASDYENLIRKYAALQVSREVAPTRTAHEQRQPASKPICK
jgi:CTP:molybdopterin cytidylyltransferase MocA